MHGRRAFEERLSAALEHARADGSLVAVIVGELMGLLSVHARFGYDTGTEAVLEAQRRIETAVHGFVDFVARIGEAEFALLVGGVAEREDTARVVNRLHAALDAPVVVRGEPVTLRLALAVNLGPGRRRTDVDLLWRTAEDSNLARAAAVQRAVSQIGARAGTLDAVARVFVEEGVARFGTEACLITMGDRMWHSPSALPARPADGELPLETDGRTIGTLRFWGVQPGERDMPTVRLVLGYVAAALDRAAAMDETDQRAGTDSLTGLLNRRGLTAAMRVEDRAYAVAMLDLDNVDVVNLEHGRSVGDLVLIDVASLMQRGRPGDLAARWDSEEMVIVMPDTPVDGAVARVQRLLDEARSFVRVADIGPIGFAAGVTASGAREPLTEAIGRADAAVSRARASGRARVEVS